MAAIDACSILEANNFKGKITLTSGYGMLPNIRDEYLKDKFEFFNRTYLSELKAKGIRFTPEIFESHFNKELSTLYGREVRW